MAIALWNGTLDQSKVDGSASLARTARVVFDGLPDGEWTVRESRVDADHSNVAALRSSTRRDRLAEADDRGQRPARGGRRLAGVTGADRLSRQVHEEPDEMPNPSIVLVELVRPA